MNVLLNKFNYTTFTTLVRNGTFTHFFICILVRTVGVEKKMNFR